MTDIIIVGVGGQGVVLAGHLIANAATLEGYHVRVGESRGLAKRGGSVRCDIRLTHNRYVSPLIPERGADLLLAFEPGEALRYAAYVKPDGWILVLWEPRPSPALLPDLKHGRLRYPSEEELRQSLMQFTHNVKIVRVPHKLRRFSNTFLLGLALGVGALPLKVESVQTAIQRIVPRAIDQNLEALQAGLAAAQA